MFGNFLEHYQIVRQKLFDEQLRNIADSFKRMEELDSAIDWALCRFNAIEMADDIIPLSKAGYYLWVLPTFPTKDFPHLRIVFHVNEGLKKITLIEVSEAF